MTYEQKITSELEFWKFKILQKPSLLSKVTDKVQKKINSVIPDKVHQAITAAIKQMVKTVLFGSTFTTSKPVTDLTLMHREALIKQKIENYKNTGAAEGGITGAGGFLMSLADFPLLLGIKMKMLFDIAAIYGYDVKDYRERLYILHIFQLAFSSKGESQQVFIKMQDWDNKAHKLPTNIDEFDWLTFQQQYRDYIDLAKLAQMLPFVGAAVGAVANYKLIEKLGKTAMMSYRMRHFSFQYAVTSTQEENPKLKTGN
ncbi:EcsC family protein [Pedobacter sp. HDW13]|uniref:EcsC family protein n=1 Tax=unclassified Pedobacter TaxID=2628915 RepID=UPI000F5A62B3|nr:MULTISPECIES: EcsC family protein [unclassified Pedobacter]QIL40870.1 EcsC family protein [Pedobacter sp. HDW13]RQO71318.1 ABC transporter-associated protein EcsC [Pedobacter sp. KBW01]